MYLEDLKLTLEVNTKIDSIYNQLYDLQSILIENEEYQNAMKVQNVINSIVDNLI